MSEEKNMTAQAEQFEDTIKEEPIVETTNESIINPLTPAEEVEEHADNEVKDVHIDEIPVLEELNLQELASKSLKEIIQLFQNLIEKGDQQEMYKYADALKAAFYKALKREKIASGFLAPVENSVIENEEDIENESETSSVSENPFAELERGFKSLYSQYKTSRAAFLQEMEHKKGENLLVKQSIIEELKSLLDNQEDINKTFNEFRSIQTKWRESGPVPQTKVKDIYDTYQHYVEMFYDFVKINNELRDLDFKKNLEAKTDLCEKAEKLIDEPNVVNAFAQLQKLHEEWKEFGPVEREFRESIWERFKEATSKINKKHQAYFEEIKDEQKENLTAKRAICEEAEAIAAGEITDSNGWNKSSKDLENLQKKWKTIGFASKKDNQKIYDRFRAACDSFYNKKREYYSQFKDQMSQNMDKKISLCEQAEALKESTDWKKTSDLLIALQKEWKETGPVSRKKSEQIWNRFRSACDYFFDNKDKNFGGVDPQYVDNLMKKRSLIEEIKSFATSGDREADNNILKQFYARWNEIGFVPFKEKDTIQNEFRAAVDDKFPGSSKGRRVGSHQSSGRNQRNIDPLHAEREKLIQKFRKKESEIATYENNIGFFASSKNADVLLKGVNKKIEEAKAELKEIEDKIKSIDNQVEE
jgi:hypothetical protein